MKKIFFSFIIVVSLVCTVWAEDLWIEAESFDDYGGWVIDQQFMDQMGSPYLMAHGLGKTVKNATISFNIEESGEYQILARTYNWVSPWYDGEGPGAFCLQVDDQTFSTLGTVGGEWMWQEAASLFLEKGQHQLALKDLTGFNGRCDALYLTTNKALKMPNGGDALAQMRQKWLTGNTTPLSAGEFDFVVVGGGIAGISAAVSAARLGCKVALINDRPILGGNNSAEVRVHLGGRIEMQPYPALGGLQKEFGHLRSGNAQPAEYYEDEKKAQIVANEENITLFENTRAIGVKTKNNQIVSVLSQNIQTGKQLFFKAPIFADCTGDGTIGYLAGADYRMGREARSEYNESRAPEVADHQIMGASIQWYAQKTRRKSNFPIFEYGIQFNDDNCDKILKGDWNWEAGMNLDPFVKAEEIRDYGLLVVFSNWSYLKNRLKFNLKFQRQELAWVAYIAGKRESRRLLGDHVLTQNDIVDEKYYEDGTASTTWTIDLHTPDPQNSKCFPNKEYKSIATHTAIYPYPIPYRCLYSRNIKNLFMAGRDISVTHVALGTVRVMRTTGMMGEVVGMAASICKEKKVLPRQIYEDYFPELKVLMQKGVGKEGFENKQTFNLGNSLINRQ